MGFRGNRGGKGGKGGGGKGGKGKGDRDAKRQRTGEDGEWKDGTPRTLHFSLKQHFNLCLCCTVLSVKCHTSTLMGSSGSHRMRSFKLSMCVNTSPVIHHLIDVEFTLWHRENCLLELCVDIAACVTHETVFVCLRVWPW